MDKSVRAGRRAIVAGIGSAVALTAVSANPAMAASGVSRAARSTSTRRVTQFVALSYTYDAATRRTTVTRERRVVVVARFVGSAVLLTNRLGRWVRVPYVWNRARGALVYDHYLYLGLMGLTAHPRVASTTPYVTTEPIRHLLRRATFGVSPSSLARAESLGFDAWLEEQLAAARIPDPVSDSIQARMPNQTAPIWHVNDLISTGVINGWNQMMDVRTAFTARAIWSRRQLQVVMEDFWSNHFNVTCPGDSIAESRASYQRMLLNGALGRFADLLWDVTSHPSMLTYLNNRDSTWQHPNENQGRELLELHSVGVGAGYGEVGVLNSARILTGLSVSSDSGEFLYEPWRHWTGTVDVLGFSEANPSQEGGFGVAQRYVNYLAHHPATATRIATKLAVHFVSDSPSAALISSLAATYLRNDTQLVPVLRALFHSTEFLNSAGDKVRRPFESIVATARLLEYGADVAPGTDGISAMAWQAGDGGNAPFAWGPPDGYPDHAEAWASTAVTISRWNTTLDLVAGWWPNQILRPNLATWLFGPKLPATHGALLDAAAMRLFGFKLRVDHQNSILTFIGSAAGDPVDATSGAVTWQLASWIALLLDSPYHLYR